MRHDGVASGYPTPTGFRRLTSYQRDPRDKDVTYIVSIDTDTRYIDDDISRYFKTWL